MDTRSVSFRFLFACASVRTPIPPRFRGTLLDPPRVSFGFSIGRELFGELLSIIAWRID